MTIELTQPHKRKGRAPGEASILLTRLVLFWERFWPAILPALAVPYAIVIFSLFGLWRSTPFWLHVLTLMLGAVCFIAALWRDMRAVRLPSRREAQLRLEQNGRVFHAPLQALDDAPFNPGAGDHPLWRAHLEASAERARNARLGGVKSRIDTRDPYGLRFTALGVLAVALIAAGDDWRPRLAGALTPGAGAAGGMLVADMWIEPPDYTGKPPVYLLRAGEDMPETARQIDAPEGSRLVAQVNGRGRARLDYTTNTDQFRAAFAREGAAARSEITLVETGVLRLRLGGKEFRMPIGVIADADPAVAFTKNPASTDTALLAFSYMADDDYGIAGASLDYRLDPEQTRPLDAPTFDAQALGVVRRLEMEGAAGGAEIDAALDLQADPWAGLDVYVKITVTDGAGQTGQSEEVRVTLPARQFYNPLAKSVIEQRQTLSVAAEDWPKAARSFDAVTLAPEVFFENTSDYLLLRTAFWRVMRQDGEGFEDAIEKFWPLALQLEDEALELARQRLEAAQEALRQALERGAGDEEIERLVEELRQAMNDYLEALAQSGQPQEQAAQGGDQIDQSELDKMLDAIRDLAQTGADNAARQMLSDLENLLNNLRLSQGAGQGGDQGQGAQQGESGSAGKAGDLIGRQRGLADQAFERGQSYGENGDDLADAENALGGELDDLIDALQGDKGADPNGEAARAMGRARNSMREAEQALQNGDFDAASSAMEEAVDNLRDGAEALAREQMRQAEQGREGQGAPDLDPLGRPSGDAFGQAVEVPEETEAGRTRAVIEELRRRLGEPGRTEEEIDYLERLLNRF